jgi:ABC-type transport system substrate-binding protein
MSLHRWLPIILIVAVVGCWTSTPDKDGTSSGTETGNDKNSQGGADKATEKSQLTAGGVEPAKDDTLITYYPDDPDTLNLVNASDNVSDALQKQVYEYLGRQSFKDPDVLEPALAEKWEFDEKTLTYTIHLRQGVYWHPMQLPNGEDLPKTEFTSADVKFTFDCILNENTEATSLRSYYANTDAKEGEDPVKIKVTVVDEYTVKVQWNKPYFLSQEFTLGIQIMPRHVYSVDAKGEPVSLDFRNSKEFAELFNNHWANTKMCGTGPLIFEDWKKDTEVSFRRNPDYWGAPFYFSRLIYKNIKNPNTALQQTLQREIDFGGIPQKDQYVQSKDAEPVKAGDVKLISYDYPGYRYLGFNLRREFFKDPKVRQAIAHAVPIDEIIDKVYFGLATRITGPFLPGSTSNDATLPPIPYDSEKAKSLLDEAGWKDTDGDGLRDKMVDGKKIDAVFDTMIFSDSPQFRQIAEIIRENCRQLGVDCKLTPTQWALMLQNLRKKEFDACILGWVMDWKQDPFQLWHGSQADLPESSNSIGYKNPEVDKLIEELRMTIDQKKQVELFHKIHKLIYDDQPYVFLFSEQATAGYNSRLQNITNYKLRPGYDVREWYSNKPRILGK